MKKIIIAITMSALSFPANAEDWVEFSNRGDGKSVFFYDRETIERDSSSAKIVIAQTNLNFEPVVGGKAFVMMSYNCERRTQAIVAKIVQYADGRVYSENRYDEYQQRSNESYVSEGEEFKAFKAACG